jgi:hypothetical protein
MLAKNSGCPAQLAQRLWQKQPSLLTPAVTHPVVRTTIKQVGRSVKGSRISRSCNLHQAVASPIMRDLAGRMHYGRYLSESGLHLESRDKSPGAGLRPWRKDTYLLKPQPHDGRLIVHNFGHAGARITMCWVARMR